MLQEKSSLEKDIEQCKGGTGEFSSETFRQVYCALGLEHQCTYKKFSVCTNPLYFKDNRVNIR